MKVLYISGMYPTPAFPQKGTFCHEQVKALRNLGVDVDVAVPVPIYDRSVRQTSWIYEGVPIRYVRFFKLPGAMDFQRTGKNLVPMLDRAFKLDEYDIYHADAALPAGQAAMIASERYRKPFVVHGHGLDVFLDESYSDKPNCHAIAAACEEVFQRTAAVCAVSQKVLDRVKTRVDVGARGHVVYNGVDTDVFSPGPPRTAEEPIQLISVGNLIPLKGHDLTLRALRALLDEGYSVKLKLVGAGPLESNLKALADSLALTDAVEFTGSVPYDRVRQLMQESDVFVLPSWYEAFGCVYLEAMACGLPAIGCYGNGIDEVIEDGVTGYLIENKNLQQLIEKLRLLTDRDIIRTIGAAARGIVKERFRWTCSAESLATVYKTVCIPQGGNHYGILADSR